MIKFIKEEWNRLKTSALRRLIYLIIIAVILGRLSMYFPDNMFLRILVLLPFIYLLYIVLKAIIYAWIINPYLAWKERRKK